MEFNLSEKIETHIDMGDMGYGDGCSHAEEFKFVRIEDVKEFIRILKEEMNGIFEEYPGALKKLNELAGEQLK